MTTYAEQITAFEQKRAAHFGRLEAIATAAADAGSTLDASQKEEKDNLTADIKEIDEHLTFLRDMERLTAVKAVPAVGYTPEAGATSRGGEPIVIKAQPKLAAGIEFARLVKSLGMAKG